MYISYIVFRFKGVDIKLFSGNYANFEHFMPANIKGNASEET